MSQLCSICHKNEAVIFVRIYSEHGEDEKGLCPSCAVKYFQDKTEIAELSIDEKLLHVIDEMKDLLSGIVSDIADISQVMETQSKNSLRCPSCGTDYEDFRQTGLFGCPMCYQTFEQTLNDFVFELHRGAYHRGKMPDPFARFYVLKKEIVFLNHQLKKLLHSEEYEKAAIVQKKLKKLIGKYGLGREDENN